MSIKRSIGYLLAGLVAFVFATGFLGFCQKNYAPCTLEFTSPGNGQVFSPGTEMVEVTGIVKEGSAKPAALFVGNTKLPMNAATSAFSYKWLVPQDKVMSTCTFLIVDQKGISTKERITVILGNSIDPTAASPVTDNGARLLLTQSVLNVVTDAAADIINKYKNDPIYGWNYNEPISGLKGSGDSNSPFKSLLAEPFLHDATKFKENWAGVLELNPERDKGGYKQGMFNIGDVSFKIDSNVGSELSCSLQITPSSAVVPKWYHDYKNNPNLAKALWIQGVYYNDVFDTHVYFNAGQVDIKNVKIKLIRDNTGMLNAHIDLGNATFKIEGIDYYLGSLVWSLPDDAFNFVIGQVQKLYLNKLTGDKAIIVPLTNIDKFETQFNNMDIAVWLMNPNVFSGDDQGLTIDLGIGTKLSDGYFPLYPLATGFFTSGPSVLPELTVQGDENIKIAINDNVVNNAAFVAIQGGLLAEGMDVTERFRAEIIKQGLTPGKNFKATVKLVTPPVIDFTQSSVQVFGEPVTRPAALYIHNLIFEMTNILDVKYQTYLKMSWDGDLGIKLTLSEDGTRIKGSIEDSTSDSSITICYENVGNVAFYPVLGKEIANGLFNSVLGVIDFEIPVIDQYGLKLEASIVDITSVNHNIVASLKLVNK